MKRVSFAEETKIENSNEMIELDECDRNINESNGNSKDSKNKRTLAGDTGSIDESRNDRQSFHSERPKRRTSELILNQDDEQEDANELRD